MGGKCSKKGRSTIYQRLAKLGDAVGRVRVDDGAKRAILEGKALLPAGVVGVDGDFDKNVGAARRCAGPCTLLPTPPPP